MTQLKESVLTSDDLLRRVRNADNMLWSAHRRERQELLWMRHQAMRDALSAGCTHDDIASALGVRVADIAYILGVAVKRAPQQRS